MPDVSEKNTDLDMQF